MSAISLKQCIVMGDNTPLSWGLRAANRCEDFFRHGEETLMPILAAEGRQVTALRPSLRPSRNSYPQVVHYSYWTSALKIIGYITVILPLIIGIVVLVNRQRFVVSDLEALIEKNQPIRPEAEEQKASRKAESQDNNIADVSHILGGIYLGNGSSFLEATGPDMNLDLVIRGTLQGKRRTDNPHNFHHVITLCPLAAFTDRAPDLFNDAAATLITAQAAERTIRASMAKNGTEWSYIGRAVSDIPIGRKGNDSEESKCLKWNSFIHAASFIGDDLSKLEIVGASDAFIENGMKEKSSAVNVLALEQYFCHGFAALDEAIYGGKKILVHCSEGKSRSASLVIAYFINRFRMTADAATGFLQSRRSCVNPGFIDGLCNYEIKLREKAAAPLSRVPD